MRDREYFTRRAEQEARLAETATHPAAAEAHSRLSSAYLQRSAAPREDTARRD